MRARCHLQQQANTCAVAALRTVIDLQYRINIPEVALEALGTSAARPIRQEGTRVSEMRRMLAGASHAFNPQPKRWRMRVARGGTRRRLDAWIERGIYPMVSITDVDDQLHMVVVLQTGPGVIHVFDPASGDEVWAWDAFTAVWAEDQWYAVAYDGA